MSIKSLILKNHFLSAAATALKKLKKDYVLRRETAKTLAGVNCGAGKIFYLGIPAHSNLGDLAQGVCIRRWLKKNYPDRQIVEVETNALVNTRFPLLDKLKELYEPDDYIVFQSGYTTTDLGGFADEMHRAVMTALPEAKMLMLPQTIYFQHKSNADRTSRCYNSMKHLLFLARDRVSFDMAKNMFPDIPVLEYPDIVTTLIGNCSFDYPRDGILFCCRDDGEKFYSDAEIAKLMSRCSTLGQTFKTDTTKRGDTAAIVKNAEKLIYDEIDQYAHYKLIITDRYHGTILSLAAGTPVIIIKTTDHKVTTGADWFRGVYDDYVYLANDLDDAYRIAELLYVKPLTHQLAPYFEEKYYGRLPEFFRESIR